MVEGRKIMKEVHSEKHAIVSSYFLVIYSICAMVILLTIGILNIYIDPLFHYHKPLDKYAYILNDERYQNNGILKQYDYDAVIIGTSMTSNFKVSELNELFGVNGVKTPFSGATYKEIADNLHTALEAQENIKMVVTSMDYSTLIEDKDAYPEQNGNFIYPTYLTDKNVLNDVNYFWNKTIFFDKTLMVLQNTKNGGTTTDFDSYANWAEYYNYGLDTLLAAGYTKSEKYASDSVLLNEEDAKIVRKNIQQNVVEIARQYPNVDFYIFIPPYSICWWEVAKSWGGVDMTIEVLRIKIEEMLEEENIHIYAFGDRKDIVCDLDNYKDTIHYGPWVNSEILREMKANENGNITNDNYKEYLERISVLYNNYDYDSIFIEEDK